LDAYEELELTEEIYLGVVTAEEIYLGVVTARLVVTKIDRAAEAIRVLNETREFWSTTWDEVKPIPASLQIPLWASPRQSRLTLDYLDILYHGSLLCQDMIVNLVMAYFALVVSPNDTRKVGAVVSILESLRDKVESALRLLSLDATAGIGNILK
jgi:hypothetical protein